VKRIRLQDLYVGFDRDDAVIVRSHARGIVLRAPAFAVAVLSACGTAQSADEIAATLGEPGRRLYDVLVRAGVLISPDDAVEEAIPHSLYGQLDLERDRLADLPRYAAFARALEAVVAGKRVVVFGGACGVIPVLAARAGASMVHVVDNGARLDAVDLVAVASGVRDRVRLEEGHPSEVELEALADVAVTEEFGIWGLPDGWSSWCERHLAPGGITVPASVACMAAPVLSERPREVLSGAFEGHGVELGPLRDAVLSDMRLATFEDGQLGAPVAAGVDDLPRGPGGTAVWLDVELADGVSVSTRAACYWRPA
jgi:hypothetical protein